MALRSPPLQAAKTAWPSSLRPADCLSMAGIGCVARLPRACHNARRILTPGWVQKIVGLARSDSATKKDSADDKVSLLEAWTVCDKLNVTNGRGSLDQSPPSLDGLLPDLYHQTMRIHPRTCGCAAPKHPSTRSAIIPNLLAFMFVRV